MTTLNEIKVMIAEEIEKLHAIGINPVVIKTVKLVKAKSFYADAWINRNMIRVSEYFLDADPMEIRATMMHELLHMCPESGRGHGFGWKSLAKRVNSAYPQYAITRCGTQLAEGHSWSLHHAANVASVKESRPIYIHKVSCPCCGRIWERTRRSNLTMHPELYKCGVCHVSLVKA